MEVGVKPFPYGYFSVNSVAVRQSEADLVVERYTPDPRFGLMTYHTKRLDGR